MRNLKTTNNSNTQSKLNKFLVSELESQTEDEARTHSFIPLDEMESLLERSAIKSKSKNEIISKLKELKDVWDFIVEDGKPIGVELANSRNQYAVIVPDKTDGYGIQYFDGTGLNGYEYVSKSSYEAFEKALLLGYANLQPGMMEYLSSRSLWMTNTSEAIHNEQPSINHKNLGLLNSYLVA
jgi:hypothetical protein